MMKTDEGREIEKLCGFLRDMFSVYDTMTNELDKSLEDAGEQINELTEKSNENAKVAKELKLKNAELQIMAADQSRMIEQLKSDMKEKTE